MTKGCRHCFWLLVSIMFQANDNVNFFNSFKDSHIFAVVKELLQVCYHSMLYSHRILSSLLQRGASVDATCAPHPKFESLPFTPGKVKSRRPGPTVHLPMSARAHQQATAHSTGRVLAPPPMDLPKDVPYAPTGSKVHHVDGVVCPPGLYHDVAHI